MSYLTQLLAFYHAHEAWLNLLFWPLATAALSLLFKKKSPEEWEAWALRKPVAAFFLELLRAVGVDPIKLLLVFQRYAARRAQKLPDDMFDRLPVSPALREALRDPKIRSAVEQAVASGLHLTEARAP